MAKKPSIVDEILAAVPESKRSVKWYQKVEPDRQAELDEILEAWKSGLFPSAMRTASRAISKVLADRGIAKVGHHGVEAWLAEKA